MRVLDEGLDVDVNAKELLRRCQEQLRLIEEDLHDDG
jgi:hypothetical protein